MEHKVLEEIGTEAQYQAANFSTYQIGSTYGPLQYRDGNPIPRGRNSGQYNETPFSNLFYEDPHGPHLVLQVRNQNTQNLGQAPFQVWDYNIDSLQQPQPGDNIRRYNYQNVVLRDEEHQIAFPNQHQIVGPNVYGQTPGHVGGWNYPMGFIVSGSRLYWYIHLPCFALQTWLNLYKPRTKQSNVTGSAA
ncbi:hypothetical protein POM88_038541 [Heracleum sosnowskyi]|uniref:Uncharacterized protein n=1 Tax=Heracleum sosnowskyi TaxID=360622 RepID=A0AAD8HBE7_9APIA|nr:hypothetical protein POM88_038541 [Heracleum sosnowskyi]